MDQSFEGMTAVYGDTEVHVWRSAVDGYWVMVENTRTATGVKSRQGVYPEDEMQAYLSECY